MIKPRVMSEIQAYRAMEGCSCNGYDIVVSRRKNRDTNERHGACLCGQVRGYRMSDGNWTVVKDLPRIFCVVPNAVPESETENGCETISG